MSGRANTYVECTNVHTLRQGQTTMILLLSLPELGLIFKTIVDCCTEILDVFAEYHERQFFDIRLG